MMTETGAWYQSADSSFAGLSSSGANGALILLAESDAERLPTLQRDVREICRTGVVGAIFPALLDETGFQNSGCWVIPFAEMPPAVLLENLDREPVMAAARIAAAVDPLLTDAPASLFMIFDAMVPNIGSILDQLYLRLADRVAYCGVNAGSETFRPMPCLFDHERVVQGGVLCLLLPGTSGVVLDHGYLAPDSMIMATATEGNRILSIDWRPAFEVYREQVSALYQVDLTRENCYRYASHFPFGMLLANDELIVRIPVALEDDGSLHCVGEVPPNAVLTLLRAPEIQAAQSAERIAERLITRFGGVSGRDLLTFYCAGRRAHLGVDAPHELARLMAASSAKRLIGALSLGEIGSLSGWGYPLFHNATVVCRPLDDRWNASAS